MNSQSDAFGIRFLNLPTGHFQFYGVRKQWFPRGTFYTQKAARLCHTTPLHKIHRNVRNEKMVPNLSPFKACLSLRSILASWNWNQKFTKYARSCTKEDVILKHFILSPVYTFEPPKGDHPQYMHWTKKNSATFCWFFTRSQAWQRVPPSNSCTKPAPQVWHAT